MSNRNTFDIGFRVMHSQGMKAKRTTCQMTAKGQKALRKISKLTGLKMIAANEQAIIEKLGRIERSIAEAAKEMA